MRKQSKYPRLAPKPGRADNGIDTFLTLQPPAGWGASPSINDPYLQSRVDHDGDAEPGVRVFKTSPESMAVQIWTHGPVGGAFNRNAKQRAVYTIFSSNRQNMLALAAEIERIAKMLPEV